MSPPNGVRRSQSFSDDLNAVAKSEPGRHTRSPSPALSTQSLRFSPKASPLPAEPASAPLPNRLVPPLHFRALAEEFAPKLSPRLELPSPRKRSPNLTDLGLRVGLPTLEALWVEASVPTLPLACSIDKIL
jgi:hypothetical protein